MPLVHDETEDKAGRDITVNAPSQHSPWVQGGLDLAKGVGVGAAKGVAGMIPESVEGKPWRDWSSSPGQGGMEGAGEWAGDIGANVAPFFAGGPIMEGASQLTKIPRFAEAISRLAFNAKNAGLIGQKGYTAARMAGKAGQSAGEGALGGTAEAAIQSEDEKDPEKAGKTLRAGAEEGGTTAFETTAAKLAYDAIPPQVKRIIAGLGVVTTVGGAGLAIRDRLGNHHWVPWHLIYAGASPLYQIGKRALGLPSAVIGAGSEYLREKMHPSAAPEEESLSK